MRYILVLVSAFLDFGGFGSSCVLRAKIILLVIAINVVLMLV
jgi:hypothetical protein